MIDVSVLIVNYNTALLTQACVESVLRQKKINFEVIVVDNNSHDNSVALLREKFAEQITIVDNQDNRGFGCANNQAFNLSRGRYVFMLNPDAIFLNDLDLFNAVQYMQDHPQVGLAGTRILNNRGELQFTAFPRYPRQRFSSINFSSLPGTIATVLGASMIATREAFLKVNGFDEDYFLYAEETDLCLRLRQQGYQIGYCEQITVQHVGGASEKGKPSAQVIRRKKSAKYLFYSKHYKPAEVIQIAYHDYRHAKWQCLLLKIKKKLMGLSAKEEGQYARHEVTRDLTKEYKHLF